MIISLLSIAAVLITGYVWLNRGFYSALLNFICTLIAGAVAFAAWEPLSLAIIGASSPNSFLDSSAWALGLALPFGLTLLLLRLIVDSTLRANVGTSDIANYVGGALLGLFAGVIVAGIMTISISFLRVDYVGAKSFEYAPSGNLKRAGQLWVPFDKFVVRFYGFLSQNSFSVDQPLAKLNPNAHELGNAMRLSAFESAGRNTLRPEDFNILGRFTVGDPDGKGDLNSLLADAWRPSTQSIADTDGNPFPPNSHLEGVIVNFKAGSKERDGRTAVGSAQVCMLLENPQTGEYKSVFPIAVSSQADPALPANARWRYDAKDVFIASIGGGSEAPFAFEFPCPPGFKPVGLFVKGIRTPIDPAQKVAMNFATAAQRDKAIATSFGQNPGAGIVGAEDPSAAPDPKIVGKINQGNVEVPGIRIGLELPQGRVLQKGAASQGNLELDAENKNAIQRGKVSIALSELPDTGLDKALKIQKLSTTSDANIVWVDVSASSRTSLLGRSLDTAEQVLPPLLVDTLGTQYQPVGYIYQDESIFELFYDPGQPIQGMSQLPSLSRSRPKQTMTLIFRVSTGRQVKFFQKGSKVINEFEPPFPVGAPPR